MRLHPGEPAVTEWESVGDGELGDRLRSLLSSGEGLVLVDGGGGAGKTTWAERIAAILRAPVVHTDDVAWNHHPFDWDDLLLDHVIEPWRRGEPVSFTPPGWVAHGRPGAVTVPVSTSLVIEGVGAGRTGLAEVGDLTIWVQSDRDVARRRALARDVEQGRTPAQAIAFWDEWMKAEDPFLAASRPWSRAKLVVRGTTGDVEDGRARVAAGPLPVPSDASDAFELTGMAVSPGTAFGLTRVVPDLDSIDEFRAGEVLVCRFTSPAWTPLLARASAVVTETGGLLSHAAIVAREFRIPAVVGVTEATRVIRTGRAVLVDGTRGSVSAVARTGTDHE